MTILDMLGILLSFGESNLGRLTKYCLIGQLNCRIMNTQRKINMLSI